MNTATLDRPMESTPVTAPAEPPMKAPVEDDSGSPQRRPITLSVRRASIVAGTGYLLLSILAGFGNYGVLAHLVTTRNAIKTANAITASKGLFVLGIGSLAAVAVLDVIVALALRKIFSPVSKSLSRLAAGLRIVYAGVFAVAIYQLVGVLHVLGNANQALQGVSAFNNIWNGGLMLFGLHLLLVGYLAYKSGYVPKWLGILIAVAGFGYLFDSVASVFSLGLTTKIASFTFIGEVALILWLLIKGRRIKLSDDLASSPE
jgi:Domain of unknown function (DUF4386)